MNNNNTQQEIEFLDILAIISFALQMSKASQASNTTLLNHLELIEEQNKTIIQQNEDIINTLKKGV